MDFCSRMENNMKYAPILLPTLNRHNHLKNCIESLKRNDWAKYTELYISVDFPVEEKYVEGYIKVKQYLSQTIQGFKEVKIFYQSENLGPYNNMKFLKEQIQKTYDRYIFIEDDNIFSHDFIEYTDKGLEIFEKDRDIIAISANGLQMDAITSGDLVKTCNISAGAVGFWCKKEAEYSKIINREWINSVAFDWKKSFNICKKDYSVFFALVSAVTRQQKVYEDDAGEITLVDNMLKIYAYTENKYAVVPAIPRAYNMGYDGSGVNCPKIEGANKIKPEINRSTSSFINFSEPLEIVSMNKRYNIEMICRIIWGFIKLGFEKYKHRRNGHEGKMGIQ